MRVYLPALSSELRDDRPPRVTAFTALVPAGATGEEAEVLEDDAQTEAALASLLRLRETGGGEAPRRIVLAADVAGSAEGGVDEGDAATVEVTVGELSWRDVHAILLDGAEAEGAVGDVLAADDQGEADDAVAALWEHALEWFDISERLILFPAGGQPAS